MAVIGPECPPASAARDVALVARSTRSTVPKVWKARMVPRIRPASPTRFTMKAFLPASAALFFSYQKPMSRYEQRPTPSQPTNMRGRLPPSTRSSMKKVNRLRYEK